MAARLYLIRHGETQWSRTGQHTGRTDLPLTAYGEQQAVKLGALLQRCRFSRVLISPLQRAVQTCQLAGFGAAGRVQPDLHEWDYGQYEGRTTAEIRAERPGWDVFRDGCPGGESPEQVAARARAVLTEVRGTAGDVAIFSHGHFLRALAVGWIDLPIRCGRHVALDTASISILGYENNDVAVPAVLLWNVVSTQMFEPAARQ
jgi:probable phosphoglycerate mutase